MDAPLEKARAVSRTCHEMMEDYISGRPVLTPTNFWGLCREIAGRQRGPLNVYPSLEHLISFARPGYPYLGPGGVFNEARFDALCWLCALSPEDLVDIGVV